MTSYFTMGESSTNSNGDSIRTMEHREKRMLELPKQLDSVPRAREFPKERHRWNTNEEVAAILISFDKHENWQKTEVQTRPPSGTMLLYSRKKVRYRKDGYCWKKRKDGKTTREDHMKLKVQGVECIYGCYVHSSILPTFHRRCYWLLQNPDIVLVHYLNVPYTDDNKMALPSLLHCHEKKEWAKEELVCQLRPMFASAGRGHNHSVTAQMTDETVDSIVEQLMDQQTQKNTPGQVQECGCLNGGHDKNCKVARQRMLSPKAGHTSRVTNASISVVPQHRPVTHLSPPHGSLPVSTQALVVTSTNNTNPASQTTTPLILSLSQIQGHNGFIILSSQAANPISIVPNHAIQLAQHQQQQQQAQPAHALAEKQPHSETTAELLHPNNLHSVTSNVADTLIASQSNLQNLPTDQNQNNDRLSATADMDGHISDILKPDTNQDFLVDDSQIQDMDHQDSPESHNPSIDDIVSNFSLQHLGQTLQLTSEEVHKTLSANLPPDHTNQPSDVHHVHNVVSSPLEAVRTSMVSPQSTDLNLETFDLLDMPDFDSENLASSLVTSDLTCNAPVVTSTPVSKSPLHVDEESPERQAVKVEPQSLVTITDYSPEWAFTEGGTKVLVTGPWFQMNSEYSVLFDSTSVPATLVQSGVLRCFCPAHTSGLVTMRVACDEHVISNACGFEYKSKQPTPSHEEKQKEWFHRTDEELKMSLVCRLQEIEKRLAAGQPGFSDNNQILLGNISNVYEEQLVAYCCELKLRPWLRESDLIRSSSCRMTVLHLAAALGYSRLINTLIKWREDNPSLILEYEVDALSNDDRACTPLMWSCARGKPEAAFALYHWNKSALKVCNNDGLLPKSIAHNYGYHSIGDKLEQLETEQQLQKQNTSSFTDVSSQQMKTAAMSNFFSLPWQQQGDLSIRIPPPPPYPGDTKLLQRKDSTSSAPPMTSPNSTQSEDTLTARRARLQKRISVDVLPNFPQTLIESKFSKPDFALGFDSRGIRSQSVGEGTHGSGPNFPGMVFCGNLFGGHGGSAKKLHLQENICSGMQIDHGSGDGQDEHVAMETDQGSPFIDVEGLSPDDSEHIDRVGNPDTDAATPHQMVTLANQIIAAMPERIKSSPNQPDDPQVKIEWVEGMLAESIKRERSSSHSSYGSYSPCVTPPYADDSGISTPLADGIPGFELDDEYRYTDLNTPASSLSPASTCLQSPYSFTTDSSFPTTEEFTEYFNAPTTYMEKDFSKLTLSDQEQRKLYEAAKLIQHCYRRYKDKQQNHREKENEAAILIQSYYRRYKQYAYYKKMCHAAVLIQSQFRSYYAKKRFKRSREAATVIQNQYRAYKEHERFKKSRSAAVLIQQRFRSHYQRKRNLEEASRLQTQGVDSSLSEVSAGAGEVACQCSDNQLAGPSRGHVISESRRGSKSNDRSSLH